MRRALLIAAAAAALGAAAARGDDKVELSGGKTVTGVIVSETDDDVVVRVGKDALTIPRRIVVRVERDPGIPDAERRLAVPAAAPARPVPAADAKARADGDPKADPKADPKSVPRADPKAANSAPAGADAPLLAAFASPVREESARAAERILAEWPATAGTLSAAAAHPNASVRREAMLLLDRADLAGASSLIVAGCRDADASVRTLAVRALRRRKVADAERGLVALLAGDPVAAVRFEVLRTLEDVGTPACLDTVIRSLEKETDVESRRRYVRVLRKLTGEDHGDDLPAWREAATRARDRAARPPR